MTEIKALQKAALCELMTGWNSGLGWIAVPKEAKAFCMVIVVNNTLSNGLLVVYITSGLSRSHHIYFHDKIIAFDKSDLLHAALVMKKKTKTAESCSCL